MFIGTHRHFHTNPYEFSLEPIGILIGTQWTINRNTLFFVGSPLTFSWEPIGIFVGAGTTVATRGGQGQGARTGARTVGTAGPRDGVRTAGTAGATRGGQGQGARTGASTAGATHGGQGQGARTGARTAGDDREGLRPEAEHCTSHDLGPERMRRRTVQMRERPCSPARNGRDTHAGMRENSVYFLR